MKFYNPYQFIPLEPSVEKDQISYSEIRAGEVNYIRHDRWDEDSVSGRIICKLTTISPLVIGARQDPGKKENRNEGISASPGLVHPYRDGQAIPANSLRGMISSVAETISNSAMRVLSSREEHNYFVRKSYKKALSKMGLLIQESSDFFIYPLSSATKRIKINDSRISQEQCYQYKENNKIVHADFQNSWAELNEKGEHNGILYLRGYHKDMPNKKRESFIEWDGELNHSKRIPLEPGLVDRLDTELKKRYKSSPDFPHLPKGYERDWTNKKIPLVKSGDILYYDTDTDGKQITDISYSAIWRASAGNFYDAIKTIDKNLLPWNKDRDNLTPAEALFGVVEDKPKDSSRNLASRLRFYDAEATSSIILQDSQVLKILASPKPPSPSMYFHSNRGYVSKNGLDVKSCIPNGRKRYLAHPGWDEKIKEKFRWETQDQSNSATMNQKLSCKPIPNNTEFWFHIDFENLNKEELGLLRTAITPCASFQHQLGLGKPLGLGQIMIEETDLNLIDRSQRYSPGGLESKRYFQSYKADSHLPEHYITATQYPDKALSDKTIDKTYIKTSALEYLCQIGKLDSYEQDDKGNSFPVCYPFTKEKFSEEKGYEWFMKNDDAHMPQHLQKPDPARKLPFLDSNTSNPNRSPAAGLNMKILKIGGLPPNNQRGFEEKELIKVLKSDFPEILVLAINLGKGKLEVEISSAQLLTDLNNNVPIEFTVKGHKLALRLIS